jgi:hypothetical protein
MIAISATIAIITIMIAITSGTIMTIITIMIIMIIIVITTITQAGAREADDRTLLLRGTGIFRGRSLAKTGCGR